MMTRRGPAADSTLLGMPNTCEKLQSSRHMSTGATEAAAPPAQLAAEWLQRAELSAGAVWRPVVATTPPAARRLPASKAPTASARGHLKGTTSAKKRAKLAKKAAKQTSE